MKPIVMVTTLLVAICCSTAQARTESPEGRWLLQFELRGIGTLETVVEFDGKKYLRGASVSTAPRLLAEIFPETSAQPFVLLSLETRSGSGRSGRLETVLGDADISISMKEAALSGTFAGAVNGEVTGAPFTGVLPLRRYDTVLSTIDAYTQQWLYDLRHMKTDAWERFHGRLERATAAAQDDFDMIAAFRRAWGDGLFSHYELLRPLKSLDELIDDADDRSEDRPVVRVEFTGDDIAIMTIDSFFGARIEEQIDNAFQQVILRKPKALVIDVRENGGGTLAAWPVAARLIQAESLAGYFIANRWWAEHTSLPTTEVLEATPSPVEISPQAFQKDLFSDGLLVMRVRPELTTYGGPVYVLISPRSRSATEAVIGVLHHVGRVTTVGETTAGYMLNSNLFQIAEGFTLRIPIADFFLPNHKSLEGVGVRPDISIPAQDAPEAALARIRGKR